MQNASLNILLADDDLDDCMFFREALEELSVKTKLSTVNDGAQLMKMLSETRVKPDVLFLDLNMPCKNGIECITEIKSDDLLKQLPVIIYSTSFDPDIVKLMQLSGAHYYICKPAEFHNLKKVIDKSLKLISQNKLAADEVSFVIRP